MNRCSAGFLEAKNKMRRTTIFCYVLVALIASPVGSAAQDAATPARVWVGIGVGGGSGTGAESTAATMTQVVYQRSGNHVALRFAELIQRRAGDRSYWDLDLLYGRARLGSTGDLAVSSGLSYVRMCTDPTTIDDVCSGRVGLPIVAEASLNLGFVGLGVQGFANLNGGGSYAGFLVLLKVGRLD